MDRLPESPRGSRRLLFQFDGDSVAELNWNEGRIFVMIREGDLKDRRFENDWALIEVD